MHFLTLGHVSLTLVETQDLNAKKIRSPGKLVEREVTGSTYAPFMHAIKNSEYLINGVKLYLRSNELKFTKINEISALQSEQTEQSDKDSYQTLEDKEIKDNKNNTMFLSKSMCIEGTVPVEDKSPILNVFKMPTDN